jgi:methylmalonyl-CoA mutase N-terminal domain/subunit
MWAHIMRDRFQAKDPRSWMLRFHTQTSGVTLQAQQPDVNVIRTTVQALAAVLGGTQSLHVNAKDEAIGLPTVESATLALRTQQVLAEESGVADTIDPLAGSYYVEHLTDELERAAGQLMETIETMGGAVSAIESGYQKSEIEEAAYEHLKMIESNQRVIVGVNAFQTGSEPPIELLHTDPDARTRQLERLRRVRSERDAGASEGALQRLADAAADLASNTMPAILECVEAYATLGEICDALRGVFGEYGAPRG